MRVALVHYWLVSMRGGEKVLEELCELFPEADIFTHVYDPNAVSAVIRRHTVRTTLISRLPFAKQLYKRYLPLMPVALEQLDLRAYDLIISSESGPAKGVLTRPDAFHICYCHTPMRYVWNMYLDYKSAVRPILKPFWAWIATSLRAWDQHSANRVDLFVANSHNVRRQIKKYYGREALIVHPPVDVDAFQATKSERADHYLAVGQLVRYKRMDLAIEACNRLQRKLVIIGEGEEYKALRKIAGPTITFLGKQDACTLREHYAGCRALIFPGEEDFGIVPVEAMAAGTPVVALRRGGAKETIVAGHTGVFFDRPTVDSLTRAIVNFEEIEPLFDAAAISKHARQFAKSEFKRRIMAAVEEHTSYLFKAPGEAKLQIATPSGVSIAHSPIAAEPAPSSD
jgi:glycosyltransferase involved in cell wall biosynthesis